MLQTLRRNALASHADRGTPASGQVWVSCRTQSPGPGVDKLPQSSQFGAQNANTLRRDSIGSPAIFSRQWFNPTLLLQSRDRTIEGARPQSCTTQGGDVLDHGVAVLGSTGQARQYQYRRVRIVAQRIADSIYYASRTTHDVVISRRRSDCKTWQMDRLYSLVALPKRAPIDETRGVKEASAGQCRIARTRPPNCDPIAVVTRRRDHPADHFVESRLWNGRSS